MIEFYKMHYNYQSRYLVVINEIAYVSVYKDEKCKFDQPFLTFPAKNIFIGQTKVCLLTESSGGLNNLKFDGVTSLLDCEDSKYIYISRLEVFEFRTGC